jgi:hypothetical protein
MAFLDRFRKKEKDPVADWPEEGESPTLHLAPPAVGTVRLGDSLQAARALGKPVSCRGEVGGYFLDYPRCGLEFKDDRLVCVHFNLAVEDDVTVGRHRLTFETTPVDAQVYFGDPTSDSSSPDGLRWLDFEQEGATLALEFDEDGLTCVQLYAEGYA